MPFLNIHTNLNLEAADRAALMAKASKDIAGLLSKPEQYVMVHLVAGANLMFAGSDEPGAYVELKSIRLPESQTESLSEQLCHLLESELGVSPGRVYIEFIDIQRKYWGWNGSTF